MRKAKKLLHTCQSNRTRVQGKNSAFSRFPRISVHLSQISRFSLFLPYLGHLTCRRSGLRPETTRPRSRPAAKLLEVPSPVMLVNETHQNPL